MYSKLKKTAYIFVLFLTISVSSVREARAQSGWDIALISLLTADLIVTFIPPSTGFIHPPTYQIQDTHLSRADIAEVLQHRGFKQIQSTRSNKSEFIDTLRRIAIHVKHKRKGKHRFRVIGYSYFYYVWSASYRHLGSIPRKEAKALLRSIAAELEARSKTARASLFRI